MVYVTSDLHGFSLVKFKELLNNAGFANNDFLYILGDVVDRGDDAINILLWLMSVPNAQLILGNHEAMMLSCQFICDEITEEMLNSFTYEKMQLISNWIYNGGEKTINGLKRLMKISPESVQNIFSYLHESPLYETVEVNKKDYLLVHSGLDNFSAGKSPENYTANDLLWCWPNLDDCYYEDIITVFGHTPTISYGKTYAGKILKTKTWIDVDTGAGQGGTPSLLRLDDLKEFCFLKHMEANINEKTINSNSFMPADNFIISL